MNQTKDLGDFDLGDFDNILTFTFSLSVCLLRERTNERTNDILFFLSLRVQSFVLSLRVQSFVLSLRVQGEFNLLFFHLFLITTHRVLPPYHHSINNQLNVNHGYLGSFYDEERNNI